MKDNHGFPVVQACFSCMFVNGTGIHAATNTLCRDAADKKLLPLVAGGGWRAGINSNKYIQTSVLRRIRQTYMRRRYRKISATFIK